MVSIRNTSLAWIFLTFALTICFLSLQSDAATMVKLKVINMTNTPLFITDKGSFTEMCFPSSHCSYSVVQGRSLDFGPPQPTKCTTSGANLLPYYYQCIALIDWEPDQSNTHPYCVPVLKQLEKTDDLCKEN